MKLTLFQTFLVGDIFFVGVGLLIGIFIGKTWAEDRANRVYDQVENVLTHGADSPIFKEYMATHPKEGVSQ